MLKYICQHCGCDFDEPEEMAICGRTAYIVFFFFLLFATGGIGSIILYYIYYYRKKKVCPHCKGKCEPLLRSDSPVGINLRNSIMSQKVKDKTHQINNQNKQQQFEICANCGRKIGKLETPCVFNGNVVCEECDQILRKKIK